MASNPFLDLPPQQASSTAPFSTRAPGQTGALGRSAKLPAAPKGSSRQASAVVRLAALLAASRSKGSSGFLP